MIAAHIEDTTILQVYGDKREFERRVNDYCQREGLKVGYVQDMREVNGL